jgi:hypothetical protein
MEPNKENLQSVQKRLRTQELTSKWEKFISIATFVGAIGVAALNHRKQQGGNHETKSPIRKKRSKSKRN